MKNSNLSLDAFTKPLGVFMRRASTYKAFIFFLAVAVLYGFIIWRVNVFSNAPASTSEVAAQTSAQPRIDKTTIDKIQSLQDNSVSVQALFNQARDNPFQE